MQTTDILRSKTEHNAYGQKNAPLKIEQIYGSTMFPQYSQLSADIDAASYSESGQGMPSTTTTKPTKKKKSSATLPTGATGSGGEDMPPPMEESSMMPSHALIGALIGAALGYAWKKDYAWAIGGAAVGFMGTNLYETKSIFGEMA